MWQMASHCDANNGYMSIFAINFMVSMATKWSLSLDHTIQTSKSQVVIKQVEPYHFEVQAYLSHKLDMCQLTLYCGEFDTLQTVKN